MDCSVDEIADKSRLHQSPESAGRLPKSRYFLWPLLGLGDFGRGAHFLNFGVASAGGILVAGLDHHVALLAQRLEIFA